MTIFGFGGAWPLGFGLFAGRIGGQAIILVGIGIVIPLALRLAVGGADPAALVESVRTGASSPFTLLLLLIGYILQTGSYFASLRFGLVENESIVRAIGYGLLAGLAAFLALIIAGAILGASVMLLWAVPGLAVIVGLLLLVPLLMLMAIFYTTLTAVVAVVLGVVLVMTMVLGTALGDVGFAATVLGGGSGLVVVLLLVACGLALWLAARLSCAGAIMAEGRSLNMIGAARASWALTIDDQSRITAYLAAVGLALAIVAGAIGAAIGLGATGLLSFGVDARDGGIAAALMGLIIGAPAAVISVAIPGGLYRALGRSGETAMVFA